jgi:hypothetical protein
MPQTIHRGIWALIDEANAEIETLSATEAIKAAQGDDVVIVDIRDPVRLNATVNSRRVLLHPRQLPEFWMIQQVPMPSRSSSRKRNSSFIAPAALALAHENRAGHGLEAGRAYGRRLLAPGATPAVRSRRSSRRRQRVRAA